MNIFLGFSFCRWDNYWSWHQCPYTKFRDRDGKILCHDRE